MLSHPWLDAANVTVTRRSQPLPALARSHETIIARLLDSGAGVNAQDRRFGTALQSATAYGHEMVETMPRSQGTKGNCSGTNRRRAADAESVGTYTYWVF
jgi:hypothetical protein